MGCWEPAGVPHSTLLPRGPRSHVGGVGRCTGSRLLANPRCMLTTPRARTGSPVLAGASEVGMLQIKEARVVTRSRPHGLARGGAEVRTREQDLFSPKLHHLSGSRRRGASHSAPRKAESRGRRRLVCQPSLSALKTERPGRSGGTACEWHSSVFVCVCVCVCVLKDLGMSWGPHGCAVGPPPWEGLPALLPCCVNRSGCRDGAQGRTMLGPPGHLSALLWFGDKCAERAL